MCGQEAGSQIPSCGRQKGSCPLSPVVIPLQAHGCPIGGGGGAPPAGPQGEVLGTEPAHAVLEMSMYFSDNH